VEMACQFRSALGLFWTKPHMVKNRFDFYLKNRLFFRSMEIFKPPTWENRPLSTHAIFNKKKPTHPLNE
jgi:hypothetical protein